MSGDLTGLCLYILVVFPLEKSPLMTEQVEFQLMESSFFPQLMESDPKFIGFGFLGLVCKPLEHWVYLKFSECFKLLQFNFEM